MRGAGQIRELARVAEPDVGVITNIAPVHLELVGTIEDVAAAKAELIEELTDGGTAVVPGGRAPAGPARAPATAAASSRSATEDADVHVVARGAPRREHARAARRVRAPRAHGLQLHRRPLPARRAGRRGRVRRARLPARRGRARAPARSPSATSAAPSPSFPAAGLLLNDAYNANPVAMKAAVDHLVGHRRRPAHRGRARRHVRARRRRRRVPPRRRRALRRRRRAPRRRRRPRARLPHRRARRALVRHGRRVSGGAARDRTAPAAPSSSRRRASCAWSAWPRRSPRRRSLVLRAMGASVLAMVLVLIIGPAFIRWLRAQRVRPEHPRGGAGGPQDQRGHAHHGRRAHLVRRARRLPRLQPLLRRVAHRVHRGGGQRAHRVRRRLDQDRAQALPGALGALQAAPAAAAGAVHRVRRPALRRRHHGRGRAVHLVQAGARARSASTRSSSSRWPASPTR